MNDLLPVAHCVTNESYAHVQFTNVNSTTVGPSVLRSSFSIVCCCIIYMYMYGQFLVLCAFSGNGHIAMMQQFSRVFADTLVTCHLIISLSVYSWSVSRVYECTLY